MEEACDMTWGVKERHVLIWKGQELWSGLDGHVEHVEWIRIKVFKIINDKKLLKKKHIYAKSMA